MLTSTLTVSLTFPSPEAREAWAQSSIDSEVACDVGDPDARELSFSEIPAILSALESTTTTKRIDGRLCVVGDQVDSALALAMAVAVACAVHFEASGGVVVDDRMLTVEAGEFEDHPGAPLKWEREALQLCLAG